MSTFADSLRATEPTIVPRIVLEIKQKCIEARKNGMRCIIYSPPHYGYYSDTATTNSQIYQELTDRGF